ncbi:hypothetical protein Vi05172_g10971 [Venturia inaequalis]|nr:hypothetical protein Vi05172_g10971 [Venturia inaequalis]
MLPTSKAALHKHRRVASARAVLSSQRLLGARAVLTGMYT